MRDPEFNNLNGKTCLVTGGAGFVGSNLVKKILQNGIRQVTIVDNLLSSEKSNIPEDSRIQFIMGSACDDEILQQIEDKFDFVFHLATYHGNQSSIHEPLADHENNLLPTLKLLEHVHKFTKLEKVVYSGAGCAVAEKTFGEASATKEDAPISIDMDSPYSISKIVGEFYMVYYLRQHGVPTVRARFQNVYGPGEILGAGKWRGTPATVWRNVTPTFIYKSLKSQPLPLQGGGEASRDFIYVEDIARGLIYCALKGTPGEVFNLSSGCETRIKELAELINGFTGNPSGIEIVPGRKWDRSGKRFGDPAKAKEEIGFVAQTALEDGLEKTIGWTEKNLALIKNCIHKHDSEMRNYQAKQFLSTE